MGIPRDSIGRLIGERVRAARRAREWTLDRLAERSGVSRRMVVNVESGEANPSIATLLRLAEALGIGLPSLVEPPADTGSRVTRAGEGAVLWSGAGGGRGVLVTGEEVPEVFELWEWTLAPGERHASVPHTAGARELLLVVDGEVVIEVGEETHALSAGDALRFDGGRPHAYRNDSDSRARFCLAVLEPAAGGANKEGRQDG
ncbi:helix-turn-helix domain-containing protein [Microbacterium sp. NPDC055683]